MQTLHFKRTFTFLLMLFTAISCSKEYENEANPTPPSDTNITYAKHVKPILDQNCISCHGGNTPVANLRLTTYEEAKASAKSQKLVQYIFGLQGAPIMPPSGKMSFEKTQTIENWVDQGLKE
ncbi:MAG: hypothetical protein N4A45_00280 [Flavobacteriales bacterium]|jgi:mono/diheme cytochrome c family protein|nr:hypothetical protein [Flavobacteriales bacterium]